MEVLVGALATISIGLASALTWLVRRRNSGNNPGLEAVMERLTEIRDLMVEHVAYDKAWKDGDRQFKKDVLERLKDLEVER